ncbi:hypothetical protein NIES4102_38430 [Chondrocystis sp. NIES-4102]|nr:hypothetical protein NIES4102_38430 [Chondrocystis sp. NIES-4102]
MIFHSGQLPNGRWGIFLDHQLMASVGCFDTCQKTIQFLESRLSTKKLTKLKINIAVAPYFQNIKLI